MATRVLLAIRDKDIEDLMHELLEETLTKRSDTHEPPVQTCVHSEAEARQHLKADQYDLLVVQVSIPADRKTPIVEDEMRGVKLLEFAQSEGVRPPCVVLAKTIDGRLNRRTKCFDACELVEAGESLEEELGMSLDRILRTEGARPAGHQVRARKDVRVDVKIVLRSPLRGHYVINRRGPDTYGNEGDLVIEEGQFADLLKASQRLAKEPEYKEWSEELREIGERLLDALRKNKEFDADMNAAIRAHVEQARFLFNIGEELYPLAFEAIKDHKHRFWMLDAPVMRRLPFPVTRSPLFKDGTTLDCPINCLVVESGVKGYVDDEVGSLRELKNVPKEAQWLEAFLMGQEDTRPRVRIGRVLRINKPANGKSFHDHLRDTLKEEEHEWHVVHYAGHSFYKDKKGYVFFPGPRKGDVEKVDIEEFASWLRRTALVYMSSCHSSESSIVFELARNSVPAIVGFRWDIDDTRAEEHARAFYTDLFAGSQSLEYAFLKARQDAYTADKTDRTWAAPMLILQMQD